MPVPGDVNNTGGNNTYRFVAVTARYRKTLGRSLAGSPDRQNPHLQTTTQFPEILHKRCF